MKILRPLALVVGLISPLPAADDIYCVQSRASTPDFQLFLHLNDDSSIASSGPVFVLHGIYGGTFLNGSFYAIEKENFTFDDYLAIIPHEGASSGVGSRIGTSPIAFPDMEALVNVNGSLIGASVDLPGHVTRFISIDMNGVGTLIGTGSTDVMVFGLAYDPVGGVLYGAGKANASVTGNNLYTINPATGDTTLVGPMGPVIQSLSWSSTHGLIGAFDHLYSISTTTGSATQIGSGDFTDGNPGTFNGIYSLAAIPPAAPAADFRIISITRTPAGMTHLEWNSETGYDFQVKYGTSLSAAAITPVSAVMPGTAGTMTYMHSSSDPAGFYQVEKTAAP